MNGAGNCGYCEVLYFDEKADGVHRAGCPNKAFGSGKEFLPAEERIEGALRVVPPSPRITVMAVDPGTTQSAYLLYDCSEENSMARFPWPVLDFGIVPNDEMLRVVASKAFDAFAIEMFESFGMPIGQEVLDACAWVGAFEDRVRTSHGKKTMRRYGRSQIKMHHCHAIKGANDSTIRQALIDRFGGRIRAIGTAKNPGPLHGISKDAWSALAIAVKFADDMKAPF